MEGMEAENTSTPANGIEDFCVKHAPKAFLPQSGAESSTHHNNMSSIPKRLAQNIKVFECTANSKKQVPLSQLLQKGKTALVSIPGAFTPTCSMQHVPDYVDNIKKLQDAGISSVMVVSQNDPFVMEEFAKRYPNAEGKVTFISDANSELADALGQTKDLSAAGLGKRSTRYCAIVDEEGNVVQFNVDEDLGYNKTTVDNVVKQMKGEQV